MPFVIGWQHALKHALSMFVPQAIKKYSVQSKILCSCLLYTSFVGHLTPVVGPRETWEGCWSPDTSGWTKGGGGEGGEEHQGGEHQGEEGIGAFAPPCPPTKRKSGATTD